MIILPDGYDPADWQSSFVGTGPFVLTSYTPGAGASFTRNGQYWGLKARPAATEFTFYDTQAPQILALSSGTVDVIGQFSVPGAEQLLGSGTSCNIIRLRSSAHYELSMRCDTAPFTDRRVRQAIALTLDRPAIVRALFKGYADIGDDSPFAPVFASTDTSISHRGKDISTARALMSAAGYPSGFAVRLTTLQFQEVSQYAQIVAQAATSIGVTIRRVPNVFLSAPLQTTNAATGTGSWNAAHFNDTQYDTLSQQYITAVDLSTQRTIAGQIQTLLLDQTPIIYGYFFNHLTAAAANVTGVYPTAMGGLFLSNAVKT